MQSAKPILGKPSFPDDHRTVTVIGFISVLVEHQESVLLLAMNQKAGSPVLVRPVVEAAYRALWINLPARQGNDDPHASPEGVSAQLT